MIGGLEDKGKFDWSKCKETDKTVGQIEDEALFMDDLAEQQDFSLMASTLHSGIGSPRLSGIIKDDLYLSDIYKSKSSLQWWS